MGRGQERDKGQEAPKAPRAEGIAAQWDCVGGGVGRGKYLKNRNFHIFHLKNKNTRRRGGGEEKTKTEGKKIINKTKRTRKGLCAVWLSANGRVLQALPGARPPAGAAAPQVQNIERNTRYEE